MKLFECMDSDCGGKLYIVADDIIKACELFKEKTKYYPETVYARTDCNEKDGNVIIQGQK